MLLFLITVMTFVECAVVINKLALATGPSMQTLAVVTAADVTARSTIFTRFIVTRQGFVAVGTIKSIGTNALVVVD